MPAPNNYPNATYIPAATSADTSFKTAAGVLGKVIVTALGSGAANFYDNASGHTGNLILSVPASAAVGTIYSVDVPVVNGITCQGNAALPGLTVTWL
jgi:hypothetical protein